MRQISSSLATASYQSEIVRRKLVELFFDTGTVRLWDGYGSASFMGETFVGTNGNGYFSEKKETGRVAAEGMEIAMALSQDILPLALEVTGSYQGRVGKCYIAMFDTTGSLLGIDTVFTGRMSQFIIQDQQKEPGVAITLETHMIDLNRSDEKYYTQVQQSIDYPADTSFRFKDACTVTTLSWGVTKNAPPQTTPNPRKYPSIG